MKMNVTKKMLAAFVFAAAAMNTDAQLSLGTECGCPPVASRTPVALSSLTDAQGNLPTGSTTLTCNNLYFIDQNIYVPDGGDLYIQPGTVVKGNTGSGVDAKNLIVARGGQIWAVGTEGCPIIFTAAADPLDGTYSVNNRGQWGSVLILGRATNNLTLAANGSGLAVADGEGRIEGLSSLDPRNICGGTNDEDNSGILKYVSIRHGGTQLSANNEVNGLTLGSVGRGTTIENVEIISNEDDGFEMFGGTVDLKNCVAMFCNDDYIDWDWGWRGRVQFFYGLALPGSGTAGQMDAGIEADGDDENSGLAPFANPTLYNLTIIGRNEPGKSGMILREGTNGHIANSIFANFVIGCNITNEGARPVDSDDNWLANTLNVQNNIFDQAGGTVFQFAGSPAAGANLTTWTNDGNTQASVIDYSFSYAPNAFTGAVNPVPAGGVTSTEVPPVDGWFEGVNYKGAFAPGSTPWTSSWTLGALLSFDNSLVACPEDINSDGSIDVDDFLQLIGVFNTTCGN